MSKLRTADKITVINMTTGLPQVVNRQGRQPDGWLFWALVFIVLCVAIGVGMGWAI
jgi:hypothetical protein